MHKIGRSFYPSRISNQHHNQTKLSTIENRTWHPKSKPATSCRGGKLTWFTSVARKELRSEYCWSESTKSEEIGGGEGNNRPYLPLVDELLRKLWRKDDISSDSSEEDEEKERSLLVPYRSAINQPQPPQQSNDYKESVEKNTKGDEIYLITRISVFCKFELWFVGWCVCSWFGGFCTCNWGFIRRLSLDDD